MTGKSTFEILKRQTTTTTTTTIATTATTANTTSTNGGKERITLLLLNILEPKDQRFEHFDDDDNYPLEICFEIGLVNK